MPSLMIRESSHGSCENDVTLWAAVILLAVLGFNWDDLFAMERRGGLLAACRVPAGTLNTPNTPGRAIESAIEVPQRNRAERKQKAVR